MSTDTQELIQICEQLPHAKRAEVTDFARFLLARSNMTTAQGAAEQWLTAALGAATASVTTDSVMAMTRGES